MKESAQLEWKNHAIAMLGEFVGTMVYYIAEGKQWEAEADSPLRCSCSLH